VKYVRRHAGRRLALERGALPDAEAVLLVHHRQRQVAELDAVLDQRVRAHHQRELAGLEPAQDLAPAGGGRGACEQRDGHVAAQQAVEGDQVLLGQRLGWRHERGLAAVLGGAQHRAERNHRLARAHLSHQEPLHRAAHGKVGIDGGDGALLVAGQLERQ
jgi:hypothetical protein